MNILVTGGAGFIGSAFIRMLLAPGSDHLILNVDKLSYAGNLDNLVSVADHAGYRFVKADICDATEIDRIVEDEHPDAIVHFAAESHVDRSILSPAPAFETNLRGTFNLLEAVRRFKVPRYVHVSTDEVYGSIDEPHEADETFPLNPSSPYSASKASSDLLALAYFKTFRCPVIVTRASNNYGPYQFPEKLLPLMISNALEDKPLPIYGDGMQVRDWLYVDDHCRAILSILESGQEGEIYNIGGSRALHNIDVVRMILKATAKPESLITTVADRPGHDRRYALRSDKIRSEIGWSPQMPFERGLETTINWYVQNQEWIRRVKTGAYQEYYAANYTR